MAETIVSNQNENTFWNYFLIVVVIVIIIWYVFFNNKEGFAGIFSSKNPLPKLSKLPKELDQEMKDKKMKIIQRINQVDKAMSNNVKPNLNEPFDYEQLSSNPINQYDILPHSTSHATSHATSYATSHDNLNATSHATSHDNLNTTSHATSHDNSNNTSHHILNDSNQDSTYPNLDLIRSFSSEDQRVNYGGSKIKTNINKTANGSTRLMNRVGLLDGEPVSCNILGVNNKNMDEYKKKFYSMYAHQIECPSKCKLKADGMNKGCGMGSKCSLGSDCSNINSDTSIPDTFALNYLALDNANKKSCVTCNFKPTKNPLNREWIERNYPLYDDLPEDIKIADEARLKKMNQIDANVSNYINFENNVYQDSNSGESAPDRINEIRINEIRTCQDAYGTCSLKDYGTSIANAYDKLTANHAYTSRNSCSPYQLTGILEDAAPTDMYASIQ